MITATNKTTGEKVINPINIYKKSTSKTSSNGVSIFTNDADVELKVEKIDSDSDVYKSIKAKIQNVEKMVLYDINLLKNNIKVQPDGEVILEFDIPEGFDKTKIAVFRMEDNGTLTRLAAEIVNNKIQVRTSHFSYYVIAQLNTETGIKVSEAQVTKADQTKDNPQTGKTISIVVVSILMVVGIAIYLYTKKKNALYKI